MTPESLSAGVEGALAFVRARPAVGVAIVLGLLGAAFAVLWALQARRGLSPEAARKGVHVAMGGVTLLFPWMFSEAGPILLLCALSVALMVALRRVRVLREGVGGVIHNVERASYGEICFPLAVCVLYLLAADTPVLYAIPLLLLGLADPAAALIGLRHGLVPYRTVDGLKSREGSVAFFAVAFLCVHVPLLLFTDVGRLESLLVAAIVGALAMMLEAISWRGLDNLFVPLGSYVLLVRLLSFDAVLLAGHAVVVAAVCAGAAVWRRETTLRGSAVVAAALVGYLTWALGGTVWLIAPAVVFFTYSRLWPGLRDPEGQGHTAHHVFSVASVGVGWVLAAQAFGRPGLLFPYTLAYAGYLGLLGVERLKAAHPGWPAARLGRAAALRCSAVQLLPFLAVELARGAPSGRAVLVYGGLTLLSTALAALALARYDRWIDGETTEFGSRVARAALIAATSSLGLLAPLWLD